MKNKRTIRTLKRVGWACGFAGWLPSGKAVRKMARDQRAERKASAALFAFGGSRASNLFASLHGRAYARAAAKFLAAPKEVQEAWLK